MVEKLTSTEYIDADTLVNMVKMAFAFEDWEEVISLATNLLESAKGNINKPNIVTGEKNRTKRHISYYFGYSYLMQGLAFQKLKCYTKSLECIEHYRDLSWLNDSSDEANTIIDDFNMFATANLLTLEILTGNIDKLSDYVQFLEHNQDQILSGLITILESAILHSYNVDHVLDKLKKYIRDPSTYSEQVVATKYLPYCFLLALYYSLNNNIQNAINMSLHNLVESDKIGNDKYFKKSVVLFETLKLHASSLQTMEYSLLINKIFEGEISNEKGINLSHRFSSSHLQ